MTPHVVYYEANVDGITISCYDVNNTEEAIQNAEEWARRLQAMHGAKTVKWKASTPLGVVSAGTIKTI